jgi:hypothetical protein
LQTLSILRTDEPTRVSPTSISKPFKADEYICIHSYKALTKTEISIKKNSKVFVVEKNLNGWWFIDTPEGQGYVPKCVIKPQNENASNDERPIKTEISI